MKIGLISINMYSKGLNFASVIHTVAFQQFLLSRGIETEVIDYKPVYFDNFDLRHPADYYARKCDEIDNLKTEAERETRKKNLHRYEQKRDGFRRIYKEREARYDKFEQFIEKYYIKTKTCYDSDLLEVMDPGFDCYICVTDVIWKMDKGNRFDRGFFLASRAMENKWKIAYSASRGANFSRDQKSEAEFLRYVDDLDYISVREKSLKDYLDSRLDKEVHLVLDPVLLQDRSFYDEMAVSPEEKQYILLYYVMEKANDTKRNAIEYAKRRHMKIVEITDLPQFTSDDDYDGVEHIVKYAIGIEEWLGYIRDADCIFTNSFHATCFSILFHKKIFVGKRNGDKVTNLLEMFGLSERRIESCDDIDAMESEEIDYDAVDVILTEKRKESEDFILTAIRNCENKTREPRDYEWWRRSLMYPIIYHSGSKGNDVYVYGYRSKGGRTERLASSGNVQYYPEELVMNNGYYCFEPNGFDYRDHRFVGWHIRFRIDNRWFWYGDDGSLIMKAKGSKGKRRLFADCSRIPYIPVNNITKMVAEAVWEEDPDYVEPEPEPEPESETGSRKKTSHGLRKIVRAWRARGKKGSRR